MRDIKFREARYGWSFIHKNYLLKVEANETRRRLTHHAHDFVIWLLYEPYNSVYRVDLYRTPHCSFFSSPNGMGTVAIIWVPLICQYGDGVHPYQAMHSTSNRPFVKFFSLLFYILLTVVFRRLRDCTDTTNTTTIFNEPSLALPPASLYHHQQKGPKQ